MRFANPKAAAAYAAQPAATPRPMPSIGGPRQAVIPKPNLPIRGVGPNDGGPKPMPSTGGPRKPFMPSTGGMGKPTFMSDQLRGGASGSPMGLGMKKGGKVSSASKRADGIAQRGKTRA
jgi:hypothetical protein